MPPLPMAMCAGGSPCEGGEVLRGVQPHQRGGQGQERAVHSTRRKCDEGIASSSTVLPLSPVSPVCTLCSLVHVILLMCCSCVHMRTHLWSCVLLCAPVWSCVQLGADRFRAPEILFTPSILGSEEPGATHYSTQSTPPPLLLASVCTHAPSVLLCV